MVKDDGRIPVKAKCLVVNGSKKGRLKRRRKGVEKDLLVRGLRRTMYKTALYGSLAAKTGSSRFAGKTSRVPKSRYFSILLEQMDDDDPRSQFTELRAVECVILLTAL